MSFYWIVSFTLPDCADGNDNKIEISRYLSLYYLAINTHPHSFFRGYPRGEIRYRDEALMSVREEKKRGLSILVHFQGAIFPARPSEKTERNAILGLLASIKRCSVTHFLQTGNGTHSPAMYVIM